MGSQPYGAHSIRMMRSEMSPQMRVLEVQPQRRLVGALEGRLSSLCAVQGMFAQRVHFPFGEIEEGIDDDGSPLQTPLEWMPSCAVCMNTAHTVDIDTRKLLSHDQGWTDVQFEDIHSEMFDQAKLDLVDDSDTSMGEAVESESASEVIPTTMSFCIGIAWWKRYLREDAARLRKLRGRIARPNCVRPNCAAHSLRSLTAVSTTALEPKRPP